MKPRILLFLGFCILTFFLVLVLPNNIATAAIRDFDGDGKSDFLVRSRDPQTGQFYWWILRSSDGDHSVTQWGLQPGGTIIDDPVNRDFDGDGKNDPAIYPSGNLRTGIPISFQVQGSQRGFFAVQWVTDADQP